MSRSRLPLPDEKPVHVYRPDRRPARPAWWTRRARLLAALWAALPWLIAALALVAAVRVWRVTGLPVTLVVNGHPQTLTTHRRTVGGLLRAQRINPAEAVYLRPSADQRLRADMVVTVARRHPVIIHVDGETLIGRSDALEPRAIATDFGITLGPADDVRIIRADRPAAAEIDANPGLSAVPPLPRELAVIRAATIIVQQGDQRVSFQTTERLLGEALYRAGYDLYTADRIDPPLTTTIPSGATLTVSIDPSQAITVHADNVTRTVRTRQSTVGGLLPELGLALSGGDYTHPPLDAPLAPGGSVRVVRVTEQVRIEYASLPYKTTFTPDPDLELDRQLVLQEGQPGRLARQVRVRLENGVVVSRALEAEWVTQQPQAEVVAYGTKVVIRELVTAEGTFRYWRHLRMLATSYSPLNATDKQPGDPFFGIAGTGVPVRKGVIAVDPTVINLYTNMYVGGYGPGRALDVGGKIKGYRIDLGYTDEELVLWHEWVDVYLLVPVPPRDEMVWIMP